MYMKMKEIILNGDAPNSNIGLIKNLKGGELVAQAGEMAMAIHDCYVY